jgi:soluble lytic murein transglycosylase-like protein
MKQCEMVAKAADKFEIDPYLMIALAYHESRFETGLTSSAGAKGVMQVKRQFVDCAGCSEIEYGIKAYQIWLAKSEGDTCLALGRYTVGNKGQCGKRSKAIIKLASDLACLASKDNDCHDC